MRIQPQEFPRLPDNDQLGGKDAQERGQGKAKPLPKCIEEAIADLRP